MKTLKTFFVLIAMVITSSGYAQTKEETIEWLNTNGSVLSKTYLRGSGDRDKYDRIDIQFSKIKNDTVEFLALLMMIIIPIKINTYVCLCHQFYIKMSIHCQRKLFLKIAVMAILLLNYCLSLDQRLLLGT